MPRRTSALATCGRPIASAPPDSRQHVFERHRVAGLAQALDHRLGAQAALGLIVFEQLVDRRRPERNAVAEHVDFVLAPGRVDLDARDHARAGRRLERSVGGQRVVIGYREELDASLAHEVG